LGQEDPAARRRPFTEGAPPASGPAPAPRPQELELDGEESQLFSNTVKHVLTHVMLDVTSIICKDIVRDLFKEQRGIDPLEPVREEAAPEEPEGRNGRGRKS